MYECHECQLQKETIVAMREYWYYKVRFSFILTTIPDSLFQRKIFSFSCSS
jgi:hypothetical protein